MSSGEPSASGALARAVADLHAQRTKRALAVEATRELAESLTKPEPEPERVMITEPGVYQISSADYLADPVLGGSLSSTGARLIIEQGGPAKYRYAADHPGERTTDTFDFGIAAHHQILGDLDDRIVVVEADSWRTVKAQDAAKAARAAGKTPILPKRRAVISAMAEALEAHPTAAGLLRSAGKAEQTLVWRDSETGVWCRCRIDYFRTKVEGRRLIIVDYKTAEDASDEGFSVAAARYGFHQQDQFYRAGVRALGIDAEPAFLFVVQEKDPPYLVNIVELTDEATSIGRNLNRHALHRFKECTETGDWPGYGNEVSLVSLPYWYLKAHDEESA